MSRYKQGYPNKNPIVHRKIPRKLGREPDQDNSPEAFKEYLRVKWGMDPDLIDRCYQVKSQKDFERFCSELH